MWRNPPDHLCVGVFMINPALTYDDLAEAAAFMADQLLAARSQVHGLAQQLAAAQGEVVALQGVLKFEQKRSKELRNSGTPGRSWWPIPHPT